MATSRTRKKDERAEGLEDVTASALPSSVQDEGVREKQPASVSELEQLLVDVFERTGQKVGSDDPIVAAALIQSSLMQKAGMTAANALNSAVLSAVAELAEAVKQEREQAAQLDRSVNEAIERLTAGAQTVAEQEYLAMKTRFARAAADTLTDIRRDAASGQNKRGESWWKAATIALGGIAVGLVCGVLIGKSNVPQMSTDQVRLMHNGMLLDAAWERLPASSKALIEGASAGSGKAKAKADKPQRP